MNGPLVSIGLPTYNRPRGLRRMVLGLFEQTYPHIEILVSDNCSTIAEVGDVLTDLASRDDRFTYFKQERNIGAFLNHKFVLRKAKGEFFLWVHDDDEMPRDYIERCVSRFGDSPLIQLVGPRCDRFLNKSFWYSYDTYSNLGQSTFYRLRRLIPHAYTAPNAFEQYWYGIFRREALLACVWKPAKAPFRTIFSLFFRISGIGFIHLADDMVLTKNTSSAELEKYKKADYVHRPWIFRWMGRDLEEILPVTIAMLSTICASRNLSIRKKCFLVLVCAKYFFSAAATIVRDQSRRKVNSLRQRMVLKGKV